MLCQNCGKDNDTGTVFCINCGARIAEQWFGKNILK